MNQSSTLPVPAFAHPGSVIRSSNHSHIKNSLDHQNATAQQPLLSQPVNALSRPSQETQVSLVLALSNIRLT